VRLPISSLIDARSNMEKNYGEEEQLLRARARGICRTNIWTRLISGTSDNVYLVSHIDTYIT